MNVLFTYNDFLSISPLFTLLFGLLLILLLESISTKQFSALVTLIAITIAIFLTIFAPPSNNLLLTSWIHFDSFAKFFTLFFLGIGFGTTLLAIPFFKQHQASQGEFYFLLLSSILGLILIADSVDFLILFIGIETLSISLYVLCGYMKKWEISHEASVKYFLMGALGASFLVYGIALIYGAIGHTHLPALLDAHRALANPSDQALFLCGIALITFGLGFKAAIVPFHFWAPDVYEGASNPVTAFMAVGTKVGAFAALSRIFLESLPQFDPLWNQSIVLLAFLTLIYANFLAIQQIQLRRFFAYSGISHAGFLLIPFAVGTMNALPALEFYLVVYALATLGCFAVIAYLDRSAQGVLMSDLNGLFYRSPTLALIFSLFLLTLAGFPPTAGFFAKLYLFKLAFEAQYYALVVVALLITILSAFYYLRIIANMFISHETEVRIHKSYSLMLLNALTVVGILFLSVYPMSLI